MARKSLQLGIVVLASSSCIVTGSPDFSDGESTKPILTVVAPAVTELLCIAPQENVFLPQTFTVRVESEDLPGEPLNAVLLRDYGTSSSPGAQPWSAEYERTVVPEGSLNDGPRPISLTWSINKGEQPGHCYSLTMMVVRNPYGKDPYFYCPTDDQFDAVTWFAALEQDGDCQAALATCPIRSTGDQFEYCPNPDELTRADGGTP